MISARVYSPGDATHIEPAAIGGALAKLEHYPNHSFVVAYAAGLVQVSLFVGTSWLISIRDEAPAAHHWSVEKARRRYERTRGSVVSVGHLSMCCSMSSSMATSTPSVVSRPPGTDRGQHPRRDPRRGAVRPAGDLQHPAQAAPFAPNVAPLRDVLAAVLRKETSWADDAAVVNLQDVYDHVLRILELINSHRELLSNAVDAHLALMSPTASTTR